MLHFLEENKEWLVGIIASVSAFFGGRKSQKQVEKNAELAHIEKVREIEKKLLSDMEAHVHKLIKYNDYLEGVVEEVKKKLVKYIDKYGELEG